MEVVKMNRQLNSKGFDEMSQRRQRWADSMTPEQYEEANAARNRANAELSDAERERLHASDARMLSSRQASLGLPGSETPLADAGDRVGLGIDRIR